MDCENSMTSTAILRWYSELKDGKGAAVEKLWQLYFQRMVQLAGRKLRGTNRSARDEEDIALSAFKSFCLGIQEGRFRADSSQIHLWPLLVTLTINKSIDYVRSQSRAKRGGCDRATIRETEDFSLDELVGNDPSPEMQSALKDSFEKLFQALDATNDASLRAIALMTLEGSSTSEIASQLDHCSIRTIQRKLKTIRSIWESHFP